MATKKHAAKVKSARATTPRKKSAEQKPVATKRPATIKDKVSVARQVQGFVEFLREQSVVGLAIGLVLGTQAKALVDQLMLSFINPLTGLLLPGEGTLKQKTFTVELSGKSAEFGWGAFVSSLMTFVIVAAVVYYVFKGLGLDKLDKKKED